MLRNRFWWSKRFSYLSKVFHDDISNGHLVLDSFRQTFFFENNSFSFLQLFVVAGPLDLGLGNSSHDHLGKSIHIKILNTINGGHFNCQCLQNTKTGKFNIFTLNLYNYLWAFPQNVIILYLQIVSWIKLRFEMFQ